MTGLLTTMSGMPRRGRLAAAAVALGLLGTGLASCGGHAVTAGSGPSSGSPASVHQPGRSSSGGAAPAGASQQGVRRFCAAPPGAALRAALRQSVSASLSSEVVPLGLSASGGTAYVSTWTPGFSGVAALNLGTGHLRPIQAYPDPATDQADGASAGHWLVWEQTHSLQSLDGFTVYAWDSATGRLRRIGHSLRGPGGTPWPSPWHAPVVSGNHAAWAQGYGPDGEVEVMLANLATGKVTVVRRGHTQPPFFDGSLLVWPESDQPGTQTTLHALSLATGRPAPLPAVLQAVHGTEFVVTDGTRTAYFNPGLTELYYSPAQDQRARMVLRLPAGVDFAELAIAPGSLAWATTKATYLASTRTGAYTRVTPQYGDATASGQGLVISDPPADKAAHPILPMQVLRPAGLSWRPCRQQ